MFTDVHLRNNYCLNRTKDSVGLTLNVLGHVIVEDHGDVMDVDTSACHICGHQDVLSSCLKVGQSKLSLFLTFTAMECTSIVLQDRRKKIEIF